MRKRGGIGECAKLDGSIKRRLIKGARCEEIFVKCGFTGCDSGMLTGCVEKPSARVLWNANKNAGDSLLKIPCARRRTSRIGRSLMTFSNGRASKNAEMTDAGLFAKE